MMIKIEYPADSISVKSMSPKSLPVEFATNEKAGGPYDISNATDHLFCDRNTDCRQYLVVCRKEVKDEMNSLNLVTIILRHERSVKTYHQ